MVKHVNGLNVIFLIVFSLNAHAQPIDERDVVSWTSAMLTLRYGETPFTMQTFVQTRFTQNASRFQTTVFSLWGLYRLMPSTSIGIGYTILTPINNRLLDILAVQLWHDFRINDMPMSLRFRFRPEITLPLWNSYGLLMSNEIFWGVSEPMFNQNRAQIGIRYRESRWTIDVLYQHRFINRVRELPDRIEHTLLLNFFYTITL
jgi:hypothetical protein